MGGEVARGYERRAASRCGRSVLPAASGVEICRPWARSTGSFEKCDFGLPALVRLVRRVAIDYLRSSVHSFEPLGPMPRATSNNRADNQATDHADEHAADPAQQGEIRDRIERAFGSLPARLRAAAVLALIEERPYREIADALDISLSAVKMRVARAVRRLRTSLEKMGIRP
jgi:RNA polymerase sigma factor (sigma-70 family)